MGRDQVVEITANNASSVVRQRNDIEGDKTQSMRRYAIASLLLITCACFAQRESLTTERANKPPIQTRQPNLPDDIHHDPSQPSSDEDLSRGDQPSGLQAQNPGSASPSVEKSIQLPVWLKSVVAVILGIFTVISFRIFASKRLPKSHIYRP